MMWLFVTGIILILAAMLFFYCMAMLSGDSDDDAESMYRGQDIGVEHGEAEKAGRAAL